MSTFTHAGVSRLNGEFKVRFANDGLRVKVLAKNGHKDIDIIELKHAMTKEEAVAYLLSIDFATRDGVTNQEVRAALESEQDKRSETVKQPKAPKATKPTMAGIEAKVAAKKAAPKSTVSKAEAYSQVKNTEDAPF